MKFVAHLRDLALQVVRPLAGAGIEILQKFAACSRACVRPLAGAGIEIEDGTGAWIPPAFAPSRGRELKYPSTADRVPTRVRPLAGAGIEIYASLI